MYYKKYSEIPGLPNDLKQELIQIAENYIENNIPMVSWYKRYETLNKTSIAFLEHSTFIADENGKDSGGVGFYAIPIDLHKKIIDFYQKVNNPAINFKMYILQVVTGGSFVAPHIDDPQERKAGFLYLLKAGGDNVTTTWYKVKQEYQHLTLENYSGIPYSRLDQIEKHCLEEDMWHWLNFNQIHGVTNQESLRIMLWGA